MTLLVALLPAYCFLWSVQRQSGCEFRQPVNGEVEKAKRVVTGDERTELYLPLIKEKRVALFINQTGLVGEEHRHVLDLLVEKGARVTAIFSPEHGFRGRADAGAIVEDEVDEQTGVPILSLYGQNRKKHLGEEAMGLFDVLLVDIQDVGLRYYTYYVTMCHLMDACTKYGREVIILDRPNPNGHYVDGPILDMKLRSGVGYLPIPVVHGMTLGELARMAVGEKWLNEGNECKLTVIPCLNYTHQTHYTLPVAPSPNLPNMQSIYLYPSLCPFEGTVVSMGRGTDKPFQQYGHPGMRACHSYSFTPQSMPGATHPTLLGEKCYGKDLSAIPCDSIWQRGMSLAYVIDAYRCLKNEGKADGFFTSFFDKLLGQTYVREMIVEGRSEAEIRARWKDEVEEFKLKRQKYLIYE